MKWFVKAIKQYGDFNGRARRKEYWMFCLFSVLLTIIIGIFDILADTMIQNYSGVFSVLFSVFLIIPFTAVSVRRLHDVGKNGWLVLLPTFLYIGFILIYLSGKSQVLVIYSIVTLVLMIWYFILMLKDSEQDENKYGVNPKNEIIEDILLEHYVTSFLLSLFLSCLIYAIMDKIFKIPDNIKNVVTILSIVIFFVNLLKFDNAKK